MRTPSTSVLAVAFVALLLVPAAGGSALASPRPVPVCSVCSDRVLSSAAESRDLAVSVDSSTATVRVHENASATWTARTKLSGPGVDDLRADTALATTLVDDAIVRDAVAVSARVDGDTLVARYRAPDFATRVRGAYRLDGLRDDPGRTVYTGLGADRLTVVGPPDTTPTSSPPGARVDGRRVTLTTWADGWIVFAPTGALAPLVGALAIASTVGPVFVSNAVSYLLVPGAVLVGGLLVALRAADALGAAADGSAASGTADRRATLLAALGTLAVAHPVLPDVTVLGGDYSLLLFTGGVSAVLLGGLVALRGDRLTFASALGSCVAAYLVGVAAGLAVAPLAGGPTVATSAEVGNAVVRTLPALPVVCCLPLGLVARDRRRLGLGVVVAAFSMVVVASTDLFADGGTFGLLGGVLFVGGAFAVVLSGLPFVALGRALARATASDDGAG
jgi:hypothetical protein